MDVDNPIELTNVDVSLKLFNNLIIKGSLCISKHYLMIIDANNSQNDLFILNKAIDNIKLINGNILELKTKDFKIYQLELHIQELKDVQLIMDCLTQATNEENIVELFPFTYKPPFKIIENGWLAYLLREEFTELLSGGMWIMFPANECPSYDSKVIVPVNTTEDDIKISSRLHLNGRFPVLAYYHKQSQSSLLRCSHYLPNTDKMASSDPLIKLLDHSYAFIDIRSKAISKNISLEARIVKNGCFYMEKIETLQSNFQKFIDVCQDTSVSIDQYLKRLDNSQWLDRVRHMLLVSRFVAHAVMSNTSNYIVVGDSGFDFELICTSLVQVILHSDARTIRGFQALVDREWIQAGHPFFDRCKHQMLTNKSNPMETGNETESPVFLLFLDCVWQMMQFNPTSFEFNESFLQCLANHCYFSEFGTFIGNNAQHRTEFNITSETTSLWSFINQNEILSRFINCLYDPAGKDTRNYVCWPPVLPQYIEIWKELYFGQPIPSLKIKRIIQNDTILKYKSSKNLNLKLRKLVENLETELSLTNGISS